MTTAAIETAPFGTVKRESGVTLTATDFYVAAIETAPFGTVTDLRCEKTGPLTAGEAAIETAPFGTVKLTLACRTGFGWCSRN